MVLPLALPLLGVLGAGYMGKSYLDDMITDRRREAEGERMSGLLEQSQTPGTIDWMTPRPDGTGAMQTKGPMELNRGLLGQNMMQAGYGEAGLDVLKAMWTAQDTMGVNRMLEEGRQERWQGDAAWRQQEAQRAQSNIDRSYALDYLKAVQAGQPPKMSFEEYRGIRTLEDGIDSLQKVQHYARTTTAAERASNPELLGQMRSEFQMVSLPMLGKLFEAGAMQEGELELFTAIAGDPLAFSNMTDQELGKLEALIAQAEKERRIFYEYGGLEYQERGFQPPPDSQVITADDIPPAQLDQRPRMRGQQERQQLPEAQGNGPVTSSKSRRDAR